jgi:hypothetical protein
VERAIKEAWNWLEVQGFLIPANGSNGNNGWRILSRKAEQFSNGDNINKFVVGKQQFREMLHPKIRNSVWSAFVRGEFDVAVFNAMKAVEVAVRDSGSESLQNQI